MWRILQHQSPFMQGLKDQFDISLGQITDPAMCQFGAPTGGALGKIRLFEEQGAQSPGTCIQGDPQSGRPTTNDQNVPNLMVRFNGPQQLGSIKTSFLWFVFHVIIVIYRNKYNLKIWLN